MYAPLNGTKYLEIGDFEGKSKQSSEIKRLRRTSPLWDEYSGQWSFYLSAYEGGPDFACGENIFKHIRENQEDFNDRVKRLHNINYCEPIIDFYTNFIFTESIERNGGKNADWYNTFCKDVNRRGDSVDDFMRDVSDDMQIFGMSYILVDAPQAPTKEMVSKADEEALGIRPYWVLVKPEEITDWVVDEFGAYLYVKRKQYTTRIDGAMNVLSVERYTEYTPEEIVVSEIDITTPGKPRYLGRQVLVNELRRVPLVVARHKRSKKDPYMGLSFLRDFAFNNREIMNLTSLLQEFLYRQAFNILTMQVDTNGLPQQEGSDTIIGANNILEFPKDADRPDYIYPPAEPARFIQDERSRIQQEMFRRAAQDTLNELFNGEKASGFSQAQSFSKTVPFISSRADILETVENQLMQLTMEMMSKDWDGKIKYKDRYELTNLTDALTQLQILVRDLQLPSEEFVKQELKRMVREFDGKLPVDVRTKIEKEIEDSDFDTWKKTQKEALVGKSASPGAQQKPKDSGTMVEVQKEAGVGTQSGASTKKLRPGKNKGK